jgi:hypothetical protein
MEWKKKFKKKREKNKNKIKELMACYYRVLAAATETSPRVRLKVLQSRARISPMPH